MTQGKWSIPVVLLALGPSVANGQSLLRGIVIDSSGAPVSQAQVVIEKLGLRATVGSAGEFAFSTIPRGRFVLLARSVGFEPSARELVFNGRDSLLVEIRLKLSPLRLDSLVVTADSRPISPQMRAFEERRKMGFGRFVTRAELGLREHSAMSDVLRMVSGARLVRRPEACGGGFALATSRGGDASWQPWMRCMGGSAFPPACYLTVYLDGVRVWVSGSPEPPNMDSYGVIGIEAFEVYRGPSELPTQYQATGSSCGAILLWTRTGDEYR